MATIKIFYLRAYLLRLWFLSKGLVSWEGLAQVVWEISDAANELQLVSRAFSDMAKTRDLVKV